MLTVHPSAGPMQEKRHPVPAIVFTPLLAAHSRVENLPTAGRAVVSGKNENRIIMNPQFSEQGPGLSHIVIDVRDHTEKGGDLLGLVLVHIKILLRAMERSVRSVGGHISKERLSLLHASSNELVPLLEEYIGAKPLAFTIL